MMLQFVVRASLYTGSFCDAVSLTINIRSDNRTARNLHISSDDLDSKSLVGAAIGQTIALECQSEAYPKSINYWMKNREIIIPVISYNGSYLTISKVNRLNMGAYLCIASNGIPPTVSKRVMLIVHCDHYVTEQIENGYKITMRITIKNVNSTDFGSYRCVAKNSLGETDGTIKLYGKNFYYLSFLLSTFLVYFLFHVPHTTTVTTVAPTVPLETVPVVILRPPSPNTKGFSEEIFPLHKDQLPKI
uniref:Ig-like domain-containing protein n=1 Tax=Megaselia scalaris TaxID=36166 RepID=T1GML8_MEGSC